MCDREREREERRESGNVGESVGEFVGMLKNKYIYVSMFVYALSK